MTKKTWFDLTKLSKVLYLDRNDYIKLVTTNLFDAFAVHFGWFRLFCAQYKLMVNDLLCHFVVTFTVNKNIICSWILQHPEWIVNNDQAASTRCQGFWIIIQLESIGDHHYLPESFFNSVWQWTQWRWSLLCTAKALCDVHVFVIPPMFAGLMDPQQYWVF